MNNRDDWNRHWSDLHAASLYNPAQAFRRELVLDWLSQQPRVRKHRILDIGSGQGDLIVSLVRKFPDDEVAGVEMSITGIAQSRLKAPTALFFQRDLQLVPDPNDTLLSWADLAVCSEVLEHVDEPEKVLTHAVRYLAPGARLFITVPGGPMSAFDRHIGHRQHFDTKSLTQLVRATGLIPERVSGVGFPFFNLYRLTVILRGKALIRDACGESEQRVSRPAQIAMSAFSRVLKRRLNLSSHGWQMIAVGRKPQ